eukprot:Gb_02430 [translate_table: standard]
MYYGWIGKLVEIAQTLSRTQRDPNPPPPIQLNTCSARETLPQSTVWHVFVYQHLFPLFEAKAYESHEVLMVNPRKKFDLVLKFCSPLHGSLLSSFDSQHFTTTWQDPFVHLAIAP